MLSLIFFMPASEGCKHKEEKSVHVVWSNGKAATLIISKTVLGNSSKEDIKKFLEVHLQNSNTPVLGKFGFGDGAVAFRPFIPFTPGKQYDVFYKQKLIGSVTIPVPDASEATSITAIYPSADTLPENLLKIYLKFSSPMREGQALQHIYLLDENADTIPNIFLDLQPELWNEERTTLTVWLDPGRIKRDLIPNQTLGNPLKKGKQYTLVIDDAWQNAKGLSLKKTLAKNFFVGERDGTSPQPEQWKLTSPTPNTTKPLRIEFKEPLDYFLVIETFTVLNEKEKIVEGDIAVMKNETELEFTPKLPWQQGIYRLKIESYLEDLAGNNVNRLFDRDITVKQIRTQNDFVERTFVVEK